MDKYKAHPFVSELNFDFEVSDMHRPLLDVVEALRKKREFKDAKFGYVKRTHAADTLYVCFQGDMAAAGALIYDSYTERLGVSSKLISTEKATGFEFWRYNVRWTSKAATAVSHARKFLTPLDEEDLVTLTLEDTPREVKEVSNRGSAERAAALWDIRYMDNNKQSQLIQSIPNILPVIDDMPLRMELEKIYAKWVEGEGLRKEAKSMEAWVAVINNQRGVVHIHRKGDRYKDNVPMVATMPLSDIPADISGRLHVLNMVKEGETVDGVGCRLSNDRYSFILTKEA